MPAFTQDVKYALRVIVKAPGYAIITILTLALGIGANTTIFSWINGSLLNPVPGIADQGEVVALSLSPDPTNPFPFTYPDFEALRNGQQSFVGLTSVNVAPMSLTGAGKPKRLWGMITSAQRGDPGRRPHHLLIAWCILNADDRDGQADCDHCAFLHARPSAELRLVRRRALALHFDNRSFLRAGTQDGKQHRQAIGAVVAGHRAPP
jgi:MacB-like periplasmic core domain